jgi:hypothetical protein
VRSTIHLGVVVVLSSAIAGYWRWRIQGQAQRAALRFLQAMQGNAAVAIRANGAIKVERASTDAVGIAGLEAVPAGPLERSTTLRPADRPTPTNVAGA